MDGTDTHTTPSASSYRPFRSLDPPGSAHGYVQVKSAHKARIDEKRAHNAHRRKARTKRAQTKSAHKTRQKPRLFPGVTLAIVRTCEGRFSARVCPRSAAVLCVTLAFFSPFLLPLSRLSLNSAREQLRVPRPAAARDPRAAWAARARAAPSAGGGEPSAAR